MRALGGARGLGGKRGHDRDELGVRAGQHVSEPARTAERQRVESVAPQQHDARPAELAPDRIHALLEQRVHNRSVHAARVAPGHGGAARAPVPRARPHCAEQQKRASRHRACDLDLSKDH